MLQETTAAPSTGGNAEALTQMGFANLIEHMTVVNWIVFIVLILMSVLSIYWIIYNFFKHIRLKKNSDRVIATFWETPNAQDAIRYMEEQPRSEPFSKVALDAAQAAAHHQRHDASRLAESLSRSEFVDRLDADGLNPSTIESTIRLKSGETNFLAGLIQSNKIRSATKTPLLGDLPLALEQACAYIEQTRMSLPDYVDLLEHIESRMHLVPRFRQKLRLVPLAQGRPKWRQ